MQQFHFSNHARNEMVAREIPLHLVEDVLQNPQQIVPGSPGYQVYQSKVDFGSGQIFLLRVVVTTNTDPVVVVTVYRTSKIDKYWSDQ